MTAATKTCPDIVQRYLNLLADDFEVTPSDRGCYITTPFMRPDGDAIDLELTFFPNGSVRLSDMGDTLGYLDVSGIRLTDSVLDKVRRIARRNGVDMWRGALLIDGDDAAQGDALLRLTHAVMEASCLIQSSRRSAGRIRFETEVESLILQSEAVYDVDFEVEGGKELHQFSFHVDSGRNLLIQPITAGNELYAHTWAERWAYRFQDTIAVCADFRPIAVLDDRDSRADVWTPKAQAPIRDEAILWTNKHLLEEKLRV